jgi:ferredoxin-type protein NapH
MSHETSELLKKILLKVRRWTILCVGASLFAVALALGRNVQLEGLFFGVLTGVTVGAVVHYGLKLIVTLIFGRVWCGWACWTGALLDQLPFRKSAGWVRGGWRNLRYAHFAVSLTLVLGLVFGLGYARGAVGPGAAAWFVIGNLFYWISGVGLAVVLRDNRAFCKYVCPVSVVLKVASRPALVRVAGDAQSCLACQSKACTTLCPMDIRIPDYIVAGRRVLSTECILCQQCVAICPPNTLHLSVGAGLGGLEWLEERPVRHPAAGEGRPA